MSEETVARLFHGFYSIVGVALLSLVLHTTRTLLTDYEPPRGSVREGVIFVGVIPTFVAWFVVGVAVVGVVLYFIGSLVLRLLGTGVV